jgi:hypothetical protein
MDDDQKWLAAATEIEQDIRYLKAAMGTDRRGKSSGLQQDLEYLKLVLSVYRKNAAQGVAWPKPDDLYCIHLLPYAPQQVATEMRRDFKTAF